MEWQEAQNESWFSNCIAAVPVKPAINKGMTRINPNVIARRESLLENNTGLFEVLEALFGGDITWDYTPLT